jgi:hypothetical protein
MAEDFSGDECSPIEDSAAPDTSAPESSIAETDYNVTILKQVQAIFGHLLETRLQYYTPKGLWKHIRMRGEPVNPREQQDAVEFFISLIDTIDEALKSLGESRSIGCTGYRYRKAVFWIYSDRILPSKSYRIWLPGYGPECDHESRPCSKI